MNRRKFIAAAGTAAVTTLAGCTSIAEPPEPGIEYQYDITSASAEFTEDGMSYIIGVDSTVTAVDAEAKGVVVKAGAVNENEHYIVHDEKQLGNLDAGESRSVKLEIEVSESQSYRLEEAPTNGNGKLWFRFEVEGDNFEPVVSKNYNP